MTLADRIVLFHDPARAELLLQEHDGTMKADKLERAQQRSDLGGRWLVPSNVASSGAFGRRAASAELYAATVRLWLTWR